MPSQNGRILFVAVQVTSMPVYGKQEWQKGDWKCPICSNHNYSRRIVCNHMHCPTVKFKKGDWLCPTCHNHNYASRNVCGTIRCKEAKPDGA